MGIVEIVGIDLWSFYIFKSLYILFFTSNYSSPYTVLDEIMEFTATVAEPGEAKMELIKVIRESEDLKYDRGMSKTTRIAEQADALVDSYYYSLNAAAKKGINLSKVFDEGMNI